MSSGARASVTKFYLNFSIKEIAGRLAAVVGSPALTLARSGCRGYMFMMNTASHLFGTKQKLLDQGWSLSGNVIDFAQ